MSKTITPTAGDLVTVPREPTFEMQRAAVEAIHTFATDADRGFHGYHGAWGDEAMRVYSERFAVGYRAALAASPALPAPQSGAGMREALENLAISANRVWFKYGSETDWSEWLQVKADVNAAQAALSSPAPEGEAAQGVEPTEAEIDEWAYSFANWRQGQRSTPRCEAPGKRDVQIARELVVGVLASRPAALSSPAPEGEAAQGVEIRALEWRRTPLTEFNSTAETVVGTYAVWTHHEANGLWFGHLRDGTRREASKYASEDEAKAAAQADFDRRIRSALAPPSVKQEEAGRG